MNIKNILVIVPLLGFSLSLLAGPPGGDDGKNIFISRCAACHNVNKIVVGPALGGIDQRRPIDWIVNFVHSSQTVIKNGDEYATALFEKFNKVQMPDHSDLSATDIKSIVEYIKSENKPENTNKPPFAKSGKKQTAYLPLSLQKDYWFFTGYLMAVSILVAVLLFAVQLKRFQNKLPGKEDHV